eukprot:TRINITY_DN10806_c0_g1_i1.p1 TRINITY_DN10806_c0_g1~~TRINITY_DN10806_c0_g1_i1.p1  ORF type:complete len:226 (+),score=37.69 TRINITY_DN10806_c0_g1_i1:25-702(+)
MWGNSAPERDERNGIEEPPAEIEWSNKDVAWYKIFMRPPHCIAANQPPNRPPKHLVYSHNPQWNAFPGDQEFEDRIIASLFGSVCSLESEDYIACKTGERSSGHCIPKAKEVLKCKQNVINAVNEDCKLPFDAYKYCLGINYEELFCREQMEEYNTCVTKSFGTNPYLDWQRRYYHNLRDKPIHWSLYDYYPELRKKTRPAYSTYREKFPEAYANEPPQTNNQQQ